MRSSDRLVGSPSRQSAEQFREARLVRITRGGFAILLDPFGMLDPQIVVNLLQELGVGVDLVRHGHWLGETNGFHKCFLFGVDCSKSARNEEPSSRGALNSRLASGDSGLQLNLEIALSGASAKVKPPNRLFGTGRKCVETSDDVIEDDFTSTPDSRIWDFSPIRLGAAKTGRMDAMVTANQSVRFPAPFLRNGLQRRSDAPVFQCERTLR